MLKELLINLRDKFEYEKELLIEQAQSARNDFGHLLRQL